MLTQTYQELHKHHHLYPMNIKKDLKTDAQEIWSTGLFMIVQHYNKVYYVNSTHVFLEAKIDNEINFQSRAIYVNGQYFAVIRRSYNLEIVQLQIYQPDQLIQRFPIDFKSKKLKNLQIGSDGDKFFIHMNNRLYFYDFQQQQPVLVIEEQIQAICSAFNTIFIFMNNQYHYYKDGKLILVQYRLSVSLFYGLFQAGKNYYIMTENLQELQGNNSKEYKLDTFGYSIFFATDKLLLESTFNKYLSTIYSQAYVQFLITEKNTIRYVQTYVEKLFCLQDDPAKFLCRLLITTHKLNVKQSLTIVQRQNNEVQTDGNVLTNGPRSINVVTPEQIEQLRNQVQELTIIANEVAENQQFIHLYIKQLLK